MNTLHILVAGLALVAFGSRASVAAEGNGEPFPIGQGIVNSYSASALDRDTGAALYPTFLPHTRTSALADAVLPSDSNEGLVQTAGSLPVNFTRGTVTHSQYASLQLWRLQQERRAYAQSRAER